jgi:penicillin-binding protein 2
MKEKGELDKIHLISYMVIVAFLLLVMRLWQLQILQGNEFRKLSEANRMRIVNIAAPRGILYDRNGIPLVKNSPYYYASIIPGEFDKTKVGLLSEVIHIPVQEILGKINKTDLSPFVPIRLKQGLSFNEIAYIEARRSDFPGLILEIEVNREYPFGDVGSHLIGYLGKPSPRQLEDPAMKDVPPDVFIGQWGVEKLFDSSLRGTQGKKIIEVNALGREIRMLQEAPPVKGKDINLSIDINLQKEAEKAFGERAGALVAIRPDSGEILGMVSKPSFNPNLFTKGISSDKWMILTKDNKNPMLNRAIQSQYPPGSTFKIVTAIAGLEEGVINANTKVDCRGGIHYGSWNFGCWQKHGHGVVSIHRAIVESCDVFFYEVGRRLGMDKIYVYATALGLGEKTGLELGDEKQGLIPNTKWKLEKKKLPWFLGETFNAAIGQGYVAVTPLQLAMMTSTVANGGILYKPTLIKDADPSISGKLKMAPENLEIVKSGLFGVVNEPSGTGWTAKSESIPICGKTGTAQVVTMKKGVQYSAEKFRDHAWFVAFAPVEKPEIALSVLVEHGGHGGGAAAPIARKAIEEYYKSAHPTDHKPVDH